VTDGGEAAWRGGLALIARLERAGFEAYLVGGCVRDRLLGRPLHDIDIATSARPEQVAALFRKVVPTGLKHGTVTVLEEGRSFEVTTFRRETAYSDGRHPDEVAFVSDLSSDLARRDFTFNAMAIGADGRLVDPFGGEADLRGGVVRCVGDARERFGEDALRLLRAVRFAAEFGFALAAETRDGLLARRERLALVAMERVGAELDKMAAGADPGRAFALLADCGLAAHAKEPVAGLLPAREQLPPDARWERLAGADARWTVLLLAAEAGAEEAAALARRLRFSGKRAAALAAAAAVDERLRAAGFWRRGDAEERRRAWIRAALACGKAAAAAWLAAMRAAPTLALRRAAAGAAAGAAGEPAPGAASDGAPAGGPRPGAGRQPDEQAGRQPDEPAWWQPDELARWLEDMPASAVSELAIRGDELVRLAGRPPGPWVALALAGLLERVALGEVPNEASALRAYAVSAGFGPA